MRKSVFIAMFLLAAGAAMQTARAQQPDFSGKWVISGQLVAGRGTMIISPICDFKQTGDQFAGTCKGPNGGCSAVGVIHGASIDATCRTLYSNAPGLAGFSTFHGTLDPDNIVRGRWEHSRFPGASGQFTMQKV